jgi:hypothetical protein
VPLPSFSLHVPPTSQSRHRPLLRAAFCCPSPTSLPPCSCTTVGLLVPPLPAPPLAAIRQGRRSFGRVVHSRGSPLLHPPRPRAVRRGASFGHRPPRPPLLRHAPAAIHHRPPDLHYRSVARYPPPAPLLVDRPLSSVDRGDRIGRKQT